MTLHPICSNPVEVVPDLDKELSLRVICLRIHCPRPVG